MKELIRYILSFSFIIGLHASLVYWTLFWHPKLKYDEAQMDAIMVTMVLAPTPVKPPEPKPPEPEPEPEIIRVRKPKIVHPKTKPIEPKPTQNYAPVSEEPAIDYELINTQRNLEANWQGNLFKRLAKFKRYPEGAKRRGIEGTIKVKFTVNTLGKVLNVVLITSSGNESLDKAAIELIKRAEPLPAPPIHMIKNGVAEVIAPIRYELNRGGRSRR